jgi:hypothetical protein
MLTQILAHPGLTPRIDRRRQAVDAVGVVQMGSEGSMAYGQFEARVQLRVGDVTAYNVPSRSQAR